jgi:nucleoside-diphosphate-sugar epimerase
MRVVVTGGSGRLGGFVIRELLAHGHDVLSLDRVRPAAPPCTAWQVDLTRSGDVYQALVGAEGVVHLAAYQAPDLAPDTETFTNNVATTYNVLKAAADLRVPRVVLASSIAAYGFIYAPTLWAPEYLPLDEQHPCQPVDPYGLSKLVGERLADAFARLAPLTIASLRLPGIQFDPTYADWAAQRWQQITRRAIGGFFTYIDARDAAAACRLALTAPFAGHEVFNVAAPTSTMREPTTELLARYLPPGTRFPPDRTGNWSALDSSKAARVLGFEARYGWPQALPPEPRAAPQ